MEKYRIVRVDSKRTRVNKWHEVVTGKLCTIEFLRVGEIGWLLIDGISPWEETTRFHTSLVLVIVEQDDELTIETENSVYTLKKENNYDEGNDECTQGSV